MERTQVKGKKGIPISYIFTSGVRCKWQSIVGILLLLPTYDVHVMVNVVVPCCCTTHDQFSDGYSEGRVTTKLQAVRNEDMLMAAGS